MGSVRREAKSTFLAGAAGLALGFLWLGVFHWGDRDAPLWPILACAAAGAAVGFFFDDARAKRDRAARETAAGAKWSPILAVGVVERVVAEASRAVRIDDDGANTAWFLQVDEEKILCVWDWADEAKERVEIDLVPGDAPTPLKISWTGKRLAAARPKRRFELGERKPEQCELLHGTLDDVDRLLRSKGSATPTSLAAPYAKLADAARSLGFCKLVAADQIPAVDGAIEGGAYAWYRAAGRAFDADAERLAEGGVEDLLDYMRPALAIEGWTLGEIVQTYDAEHGYTLRIGAEEHTMWSASEQHEAWELTTTRAASLIDEGLAKVGSPERVHVLRGGEDAVFVLLTREMRQTIAESGLFADEEIPTPSSSLRLASRR
ncbi:MAG: hypothetical protein KF819_31085 [Labilithrix sp.]|nr:hypothetical protein [Labilithrix sp.]